MNSFQEVREMRIAEMELDIIRERGRRGLPLERLYRQLWHADAKRWWSARVATTRFTRGVTTDLRSRKQVTGEPRDTETVKRGSEGGGWKSADSRR
jgi:hypothetical protein